MTGRLCFVPERHLEYLLVAHCGSFRPQAREFVRRERSGQRIEAGAQLRHVRPRGRARTRMNGIVVTEDPRRGRRSPLQRRKQREGRE